MLLYVDKRSFCGFAIFCETDSSSTVAPSSALISCCCCCSISSCSLISLHLISAILTPSDKSSVYIINNWTASTERAQTCPTKHSRLIKLHMVLVQVCTVEYHCLVMRESTPTRVSRAAACKHCSVCSSSVLRRNQSQHSSLCGFGYKEHLPFLRVQL